MKSSIINHFKLNKKTKIIQNQFNLLKLEDFNIFFFFILHLQSVLSGTISKYETRVNI